jgi:LAO/AO transport system kinase
MPASVPTDPAALFDAARGGNQAALARLLSLVERGGALSRAVAGLAYTTPGDAYSVGITGAPGAGKSTLTDRLVTLARTEGLSGPDRVAVLAIDPSSPYSGGAILGDRVRMPGHALDDGVYIRSMATRGHLGGLAVAVPDAVRVLSSVGMPVVLVETVGVGQQEVEVAAATDTTVVVVNPGWGDAVQANKAGLLEIADLFVINKADRPGARETRRDLELMLELTELGPWRPPIVETVASTGDGVDELWQAIGRHRSHQIDHGTLASHRRTRLEREFRQILVARLSEQIDAVLVGGEVDDISSAMLAGAIDPYVAADRVLDRMVSRGGARGVGQVP